MGELHGIEGGYLNARLPDTRMSGRQVKGARSLRWLKRICDGQC